MFDADPWNVKISYARDSLGDQTQQYGPEQQSMDDLFTETGTVLYGRYARRAGIAGYRDPSEFIINVVFMNV